MNKKTAFTALLIAALLAIPAEAQIGNIVKKVKSAVSSETKSSPKENSDPVSGTKTVPSANPSAGDADFIFVGENGLEGTALSELRACSENNRNAKTTLGPRFKQWIDEISPTAQLKMYEMGRCELMGFHVIDNPSHKYRKPEDLAERNPGRSAYEVSGDALVLIKEFSAPALYVVVVPEVAKAGLALSDLNLCVNPEKKDHYRRITKSASNCHDLKQMLYVFEQYKQYPGDLQTNSALFNEKDYTALNKQGKFKGLKVYTLVGKALEPLK
ncbi:MAG: hypothetical protein DWQ47_04320 [Acidobacteria bacterium]|nr:MAG: hypothetical protein DWQ32_07870 [Acidobacteriota bacterium]REK01617.1 MAG: hypothetical protein DWQ38_04305 [Acidobacteriota bacterium]REK14573.1 MAG: hypothetical protein DWQ43_13560 [Acidobacteriota bacterium]REK45288.1 MAG: hypothetical protein DWQ47_04320 [Acidobacteriota bacterium]